MVAVASIPKEPVLNNIEKAAGYEYQQWMGRHSSLLHKVHYTESLMLVLAGTMDEERPLESALESKTYTLTRFMQDPITDFKEMALNGTAGMKEADYNRYWHGYLVTLRPLLYFFELPDIRWYSSIVFSILATVFLMLIYRQSGALITAFFFLALLHARWFGPLVYSLDQNKVYFIIFISSIVLMKHRNLYKSVQYLPLFFIGIGACTSFMDFLTAPVLTLGVPLLIIFLKRGQTPIREQVVTLLVCSTAWCFGYVGMWASKWILCAMFTDCAVLDMVKGSIKERTIGDFTFDFCRFCKRMLYPIPDKGYIWWIWVSVILGTGLFSHLAYLFIRYRQAFLNNICYFILMLYPVIWLLGTRQHTIIHLVFTYRIVELFIIGYGVLAIKVYRTARNLSVPAAIH